MEAETYLILGPQGSGGLQPGPPGADIYYIGISHPVAVEFFYLQMNLMALCPAGNSRLHLARPDFLFT
jgi:hypothetical protein